MLGTGEIISVIVLLIGVYLLLNPPKWISTIKHRNFISNQGGVYKNPKLLKKVRKIGARLIKKNALEEFQISFHILKNIKIVNAFALPSGQIYLTLGIIQLINEEEKIAAILAHEIGHVVARHHSKRARHFARTMIMGAALQGPFLGKVTNFLLKGARAAYSQEQELEADGHSIHYLKKAGYNPMMAYYSLKKLYEFLGSSERERQPFHAFFNSHPISEERLKNLLHLADQESDS